MQLVRTAQSKHKINLLALSTEDGGPYVVATWYVVLIVCSSCVPLNSNTNTSSHSPRRTGGPQARASGACIIHNLTKQLLAPQVALQTRRFTYFGTHCRCHNYWRGSQNSRWQPVSQFPMGGAIPIIGNCSAKKGQKEYMPNILQTHRFPPQTPHPKELIEN